MQFTPAQYNWLRSLYEPKIEELRKAWKEATDEEEKLKIEDEYVIAQRAADTLETLYFNQ